MLHTLRYLAPAAVGLFLKSTVIFALGAIVFYVQERHLAGASAITCVIIAVAALKCIYFVSISYDKILEVSVKNTAYYDFIGFMAMNITVVIISFSADFFCLLKVDPFSLKGVDPG